MSVTLATARAEVSKRAQEFLSGTATGGTTSTIIDTNNLQHVDGYWDESAVLMTSGSNVDAIRRIQTFTGSTSTLNLYSALGMAVASGVTYEVYRRFSPTDVDLAINRSLNIAAPDFREKVRAVATATADTLQYAFPTGPDMMDRGLLGIEYQHYTDASQSDWPYTKLSPDQYEVIQDWNGTYNEKKLQLRFNPTTNRLIRFVFDGALGNVATGTDRIRLDLPELEWLYSQSATELWRIEASRNTDANRKAAVEEMARWEADADRLRRRLGQEAPRRPLRRTVFRVS